MATAQVESILSSLSSELKVNDEIGHRPEAPDYEAELDVFWNAANKDIRPQVILTPSTTAEAAAIVRTLAQEGIRFGVCSGGSNPNVGWNNSPDVLIATTKLNAAISFPQPDVARVGPGLKWDVVYETLLKEGRTAVGARSNAPAVAGTILGGGISHLSNKHGCASDNAVNFEVVLGSGEVVQANARENPDLFWALKGGGNSFGLVTRCDIKAIPEPGGSWGGTYMVDPQHLAETCQALHDWMLHDQPKDLNAAAEIIFLRSAATGGMEVTMPVLLIYYAAPVEYPESLKRLTDLPAVYSTLKLRPHEDLVAELSKSIEHGKRHVFYTGTFRADADLNIEAHDIFYSTLENAGISGVSLAAFTLQPIPKSMIAVGEGRCPLGLTSADAPYIWWNMTVEYDDSANDEAVMKILHTATEKVAEHAQRRGKYEKFCFLNDAGWDQDPLASYGEENYARLRRVRDRFDPQGVFTRLCTGGFKLK